MSEAAILATIPHRPPFLFIDAIIEESESAVTARRLVREDEPQFEGHYPGNPIMPGVLLCEAVFQAGAYLLVQRLQREGGSAEGLTPVLSRIQEARFKQMVKPGDTVEITAEWKETVTRFHFLKGVIRKDGRTCVTLEFTLALV